MRRIFIIRKDLHLTPGKLASQVGHAAELYWINILKNGGSYTNYNSCNQPIGQSFEFFVPYEVWTDYINGIYTKTICEARNLKNLMKAKDIADELGLKENEDYGFINDKCLTELKPENEDGTTTVGMWFAPLADEVAHQISKKFPLLRDHLESPLAVVNTDQHYVVKCNDGRYICKSPLGGVPQTKNVADEGVVRFRSIIKAKSFLAYPEDRVQPEYLPFLKGATIERVVIEQRVVVKDDCSLRDRTIDKTASESEYIRRFQEICKQSEGGLQTFKE